MPGLYGFVDIHTCCKENHFLEKMLNPLMHLEDYCTDFVRRSNVGAGIVSFSCNGRVSEDENISAIYHGDIYDVVDGCDNNLLNEGRVDASAIIKLYNKYGELLPEKLNGSFNIFIHDGERNISYLFNDRFGYKPMYHYQDTNVFLFSPEIKSFLVYDKFDNTLDPHGISDYLVYSYQFSDRTFFKNVKLLPPASVVKIMENEVSMKTYWSPVYSNSKFQKDLKNVAIEGYGLFEQSVDRCLGESQKVLVPLSGGLDSRLIASVVGKRNLDITTATFGTSKCLDYRLAKQVCQASDMSPPQLINIRSDWLQKYAEALVHYGECSYGTLGVTLQHGMAQSIKEEFDVALNGIYGGHISFGSPYYTMADVTTDYSPKERLERIRRGFNGHRFKANMQTVVTADLKAMVDEYGDETIAQEWQRSKQVSDQDVYRQDYIFLYNRIRRGMNNINQNIFFFNDKQPFASYELFDFYLTLSSELALDHCLYKEIYKELLPHLARIPWQQTGVNLYKQSSRWVDLQRSLKRKLCWYLPKLSKGRFSFFDHDQYDNHDISYRQNVHLQQWVESILLSDRSLDRDYFSKEGILGLLEKELQGKSLFFEIGKMVMFELWAREFIDGDGASIDN